MCIRDRVESLLTQLLSGVTLMFVDGYDKCMAIDCRTYPARGVQEPEKDRVLRGSRDGFVETLVFNTALIRRRIRDPKLINEIVQVGESSKTDIVISYMEDRVDRELLDKIKKRISNIKVDALTMNQESLACLLYTSHGLPHRGWHLQCLPKIWSDRMNRAFTQIIGKNKVKTKKERNIEKSAQNRVK